MESKFNDLCQKLYNRNNFIFDKLNEGQKGALVAHYIRESVKPWDQMDALCDYSKSEDLIEMVLDSMLGMENDKNIGKKIKMIFVDYYLDMARDQFEKFKDYIESSSEEAADNFDNFVIHTANLRGGLRRSVK